MMNSLRTTMMVIALLVGLHSHASVVGEEQHYASSYTTDYEPTDEYQLYRIFGFKIYVSGNLYRDERALVSTALHMMRAQLLQFHLLVSGTQLRQLRQVKIWFTTDRPDDCPELAYARYFSSDRVAMEYIGRNPDMAESVEICRMDSFVNAYSEFHYRSTLIHELAHGFHHQFLSHGDEDLDMDGHVNGFDNEDVLDAYNLALSVGRYHWNLQSNGRFGPAYASTNHHEYFAEIVTAFFATGTTYPFVKAELESYDPDGYRLVGKLFINSKRVACDAVDELRTFDNGFEVRLTFQNQTDEARSVVWFHDNELREGWTLTLDPHETDTLTTNSGHAWMVRDADNECLEVIVAGGDHETFQLGE